MKKVTNIYVLITLLFVLSGIGYQVNHSNRAAAELIGSSHQGAVNKGDGKQPSPDIKETPAAEQIGSVDPISSPGRPNQDDIKPAEQNRYYIDVNISEQKVRIFENDNLIKEWVISTGQNDSTPLGRFKIQNRGEWFFSEKYQQGAMWWVSFQDWGVYLFHSIPMDEEQNIIAEEAKKLGYPASHGCVRLEVENARWIYEHIPQATDVYIHK